MVTPRTVGRAALSRTVGRGAARRSTPPAGSRRDQGVLRPRLPPHVGRRHRAQRPHEPHRVLRVLRQPRRRDVRRAADVAARLCSTVRDACCTPAPNASLTEVGVSAYRQLPRRRSRRRRGSSSLEGRRDFARGERPAAAASAASSPTSSATSGPSTTRRPRTARTPPPSRSACSASSSSRWCTSWRPAGSTRRPSTCPRSSTRVDRVLTPHLVTGREARDRHARAHAAATRARDSGRKRRRSPTSSRSCREAERLGYHHCTCSEHVAMPVDGRRGPRRPLLGSARDVRRARRAHRDDPVRGPRARARLPPSARDREALRHARRRHAAGALILGVGVGSLQEEFDLLGAPFDDRGARADDAMPRPARRAVASASRSTHGDVLRLRRVRRRPVRGARTHVPMWVGGRTCRSLRRAVELGDGWAPVRAPHRRARRRCWPRPRHRRVDGRDNSRSRCRCRTSTRSTRSPSPNRVAEQLATLRRSARPA